MVKIENLRVGFWFGTIPRSTETGTESVPVLQIKNFSVPVSVPYLNSKSNFSPYSFLTSGSKISPYPSPYPYFILKYFLSSVPVPVPVLFPYPFRTLILYHFSPCAVFQDIDILSVYFLSKFRTRTPIYFSARTRTRTRTRTQNSDDSVSVLFFTI